MLVRRRVLLALPPRANGCLASARRWRSIVLKALARTAMAVTAVVILVAPVFPRLASPYQGRAYDASASQDPRLGQICSARRR